MKIKFYLRKLSILASQLSTLNSRFSISKGFTLIELIIVIAVVGILATIVFIAINPLGIINSANLAKAKTFSARVEHLLSISQVGKWSFDDPASPGKDTSGYGNNGVITGATLLDANACGLGFGGCLKFDGLDDYINCGSSASITSNLKAFTVSGWIKTIDTGSNIFVGFEPTGTTPPVVGPWSGNGLIIYMGTNNYRMFSPANVTDNNWHHIVFVLPGSTQNDITNSKAYVDGRELPVASTVSSGVQVSKTACVIAAGNGGNSWFYSGLIDEVAIYSQALLSSQIQQLYAQGLGRHLLANR